MATEIASAMQLFRVLEYVDDHAARHGCKHGWVGASMQARLELRRSVVRFHLTTHATVRCFFERTEQPQFGRFDL